MTSIAASRVTGPSAWAWDQELDRVDVQELYVPTENTFGTA